MPTLPRNIGIRGHFRIMRRSDAWAMKIVSFDDALSNDCAKIQP
jgi:hypothetical protein